jgi:hypothetical protein
MSGDNIGGVQVLDFKGKSQLPPMSPILSGVFSDADAGVVDLDETPIDLGTTDADDGEVF